MSLSGADEVAAAWCWSRR